MTINYIEKLHQLLYSTIERNASDLHISAGYYPVLRINGNLLGLDEWEKFSVEEARKIAFVLLGEEYREEFLKKKEVDFSYNLGDTARFRVNVFFQKGNISCSLRLVPSRIKTLEELNLPNQLYNFSNAHQGFVLVTGPASHGKSTTLAALIDRINETRFDHIITIEDPIEHIFKPKKSLIHQREIHQDAISFSKALKSVFRQDPDVILVGEMRDPETISTAITAAETGHLVFSTLHTNSASQTIHRIVDSFPAQQQGQINTQLAASLLGVVSQRLIPSFGNELVPAYEIMINTPAISNLIRRNKVHEINAYIENSTKDGMISLDKCLARMVAEKMISSESALAYSSNPSALEKMIS